HHRHEPGPGHPVADVPPPRSSGPKPCTSRSARRHSVRPPVRPCETTVMPGLNSYRTCRHAPQGGVGVGLEDVTATASTRRAPAATAEAHATRSAHIASPYEAFSTFAPRNTPRSVATAAPTVNRLYGA